MCTKPCVPGSLWSVQSFGPWTLQKWAKNYFISNFSLSINLIHFLPCTNVIHEYCKTQFSIGSVYSLRSYVPWTRAKNVCSFNPTFSFINIYFNITKNYNYIFSQNTKSYAYFMDPTINKEIN